MSNSVKILNEGGKGVVNYDNLWSTPITDSSYTLSNIYTFRSGTAMDFVYLRHNGSMWVSSNSEDLGAINTANVKYSNNIPINSNGDIDLRCSSNSVYIFCYSHRFVDNKSNKALNVRVQLKMADDFTVTVSNPIVYRKTNTALMTSISMVEIFDSLYTRVWNRFHVYLSEGCNLDQITLLMLRVNLSGYVTNPTDILYFKENIDQQTSASTQPILPLKTYTTYSKIPYNGGIKSSYAIIGQDVSNGSYTANIGSKYMMYQTAFLVKVTTYCENSDEAGVIQVDTTKDPYIQRIDSTSNTRTFYMPPLYRNLGCNYSWVPMCYPLDEAEKLSIYMVVSMSQVLL